MAKNAAHALAAEKALGLEPVGAETRTEAELRRTWERHFAPLGLALPEEAPPIDVWYRVQGALDRADDRRKIKRLRKSVWLWRSASLLLTVAVIGLAGLTVFSYFGTGPTASSESTVVTSEGGAGTPRVETDAD